MMSDKDLKGKRTRKSSSDSESTKPPSKMANRKSDECTKPVTTKMATEKNQTQLEEVRTLLDELKKGQQSLKVSLNNRISSIKTELLAAIDTVVKIRSRLSSLAFHTSCDIMTALQLPDEPGQFHLWPGIGQGS